LVVLERHGESVDLSLAFGVRRARFGAGREVVARDIELLAMPDSDRRWEADVDVVDASAKWRSRCILRPVRSGRLVPTPSADLDPELVCWTLSSERASFDLSIVLERRVMTGYVAFGARRLSVAPTHETA